MSKSNQYYYDKLRDCYNLVCENEQQRTKQAAPIKKKKPTFEKSKYIKYGSDFSDQGSGNSRIRVVDKDWDEAVEQPKRTLKEFRAAAGSTTTAATAITARDKKNIDFMQQVYRSAKVIDDFDLFIGFINHLL